MKQGMTASIMGVNAANFRATERLTSSCFSPHPMLGPRVGGEELGFSLNFTLSKGLLFCLPLHPTAHCNDFQPLMVKGSPWGLTVFSFV